MTNSQLVEPHSQPPCRHSASSLKAGNKEVYKPDMSFGRREALSYLVARQPGCFTVAKHVFDEVQLQLSLTNKASASSSSNSTLCLSPFPPNGSWRFLIPVFDLRLLWTSVSGPARQHGQWITGGGQRSCTGNARHWEPGLTNTLTVLGPHWRHSGKDHSR